MVTQVDNALVMVEPRNRRGSNTYQAVLRGTNFGSWILQRLWGYGTALLLWQTPFLRRVRGGRTGRPYACFAKHAVELFNSAAWLLSHLYLALLDPCCGSKWKSIFGRGDSACPLRSRSGERGERCVMWRCGGLWNMRPTLFLHNLLAFFFFFFVDTNWWKAADRDADFCHNAGGWLRGRTKGAKAVEDEEEEEEMTGHLPSICSPCLSSICMQLVATSSSLHIGGADGLWIYTPFINLPHRGKKPEQACEGMLWFSSEKGRRRPLVYRGGTVHLVPAGSVLLESVAFINSMLRFIKSFITRFNVNDV